MTDKKNSGTKSPIKGADYDFHQSSTQNEISDFLSRGRVSSSSEIDAFVGKLRIMKKAGSMDKNGRLIFAMDATASREPSWDQACHLQSEMFLEALNIGKLEVQLAYYRGYGEFKVTKWLCNSESLLNSMLKVRCLGGQTQIEKVLKQAIKETQQKRVQAVILIGDAFEEDIDLISHAAGQLGMLGVPVFCFHEGNDPLAKIGFTQIAKLTKGAYCSFNSSSASQLRELLKAVAIFAVGGLKELESYSKVKQGEALKISNQIKQ